MKYYRNPNFPNMVFERLQGGRKIRATDKLNAADNPLYSGWVSAVPAMVGEVVPKRKDQTVYIYRPVPHLCNLPMA